MTDTQPPTANPLASADDDDDSKGEIFATVMSNVFLFFLIFGLSATVEIKNMRQQLTNKFAIGAGVAMQFFIMPILGYLSVLVLKPHGLTESMGITLLVVTSSPGGSYSNWWCSTFNAELALSVAMTTVSSLMSIGMLPTNLLFYSWLAYGADEEESVIEALDFTTLFISLGIVMGAIILGLYCGYLWDNARFHELANRLGSISGLCLILFGLFISSGADGAESNFWEHPWAFYVGVAFPCLVGISLANIISRSFKLSPPETVAISIECCYQNTGIATSVAITMFDDVEERAQAVAVPLFYGVVEAVAIGIYCVWAWKVGWTKAPANEKLCVVVTKSYEINHDEEPHDHASDGDDEHDDDVPGALASPDNTQFENEAIVNAMETQSNKQQQERSTGGRGIWAQVRRIFGENDESNTSQPERPVELRIDPATGEVDTEQFTTPPKKSDSYRRRMTSDYTADTAGSSTPSPQVSAEREFQYSERTTL